MTNEKVIPRDVWLKLLEYFDNTEYEDLDGKKVKAIIGKYLYVPIPDNFNTKLEADIWYMRMNVLREKGKPFGNKTIDFSGDKTTLEELFGDKPIGSTQMPKILWDYIKKKGLNK